MTYPAQTARAATARTTQTARTAQASAATRLRVNPATCSGHGLCAELLPELITLDEWGYPILDDAPVPATLTRQARRAVRDCPALALMLAGTGGSR
jgi:ferredoxin